MAELREGQTGTAPDGTKVIVRGGQIVPLNATGPEAAGFTSLGGGWYRGPDGSTYQQGRGGAMVKRSGAVADPAAGGHSATGLAGADARTRLALGLGPMVEAEGRMRAAEKDGYSYNDDWAARLLEAVPLDGGGVARFAGGADYQRYDQAARTFEAAVMPIMSGAAVTPSEAQRQIRANLPQLGDSPEILQTKARNRAMMINAAAQLVGQDMPFPDVGIWGHASSERQGKDEDPLAVVGATSTGDQGSPGSGSGGQSDPNAPRPGDVRVTQQPLAPEDTPESLRAQGYVYDPERDTWTRTRHEQAPSVAEVVADRRDDNGVLRGVDAFVRGAADTATFGLSDEIAAGLNTVLPLERGSRAGWTDGFGEAFRHNLAMARGIDSADQQDMPVQRIGGQLAGAVAAPGAVAAGRYVAAAPKVGQAALRGAMTGAGFGAAYGAGSAEGDLGSRGQGAVTGGMTGGLIGGALPPVARAAGAMTGSVTRPITEMLGDTFSRFGGRPMTGEAQAVRSLLRGTNLDEMEARAAQFREYGAEPTIADVGGSNVQSRTRVAATKQTPGREAAQDFASGRRSEVQDFTAGLGRRISPTEATPAQLDEALGRYQSAASAPEFAAARAGPPIRIDPDTTQALWGPEGRAAVADAARLYASATSAEDRALAQELQALSARMNGRSNSTAVGEAADDGLEMSVGAADLISRYLAKAGGLDGNRQRIFGGLGKAVRDAARDQSDAYDDALTGFERRARLGDATEIGERFVGNKGYTGDFVEGVGAMGPDEVEVARAAARAALERSGGTARGAPGTLDALATGRDQMRRSTALLGEEGAADLRTGAQVGRRMVETGQNVNPRAGSNTFLNGQDGEQAGKVGGVIGNVMRGRFGSAIGGVFDLVRSAGLSDDQAERIVNLATDPSRTDEVLNILRERFPEREARRLMERLTPLIAGQAGGATAPQAPQVRMVGSRP